MAMGIQNTIIRGIRESLHRHDYLVLPDFGGFVLKTRFAHYGAAGNSLFPPAKTISFNLQLKQDDGILVNWLTKELNCDTKEALRQLKDFSSFCQGVLSARRRISLEGIGFFFLDFENNICFEPQADVNYHRGSFGLEPVQLKSLLPPEPLQDRPRNFVFEDRPATAGSNQSQRPRVSVRRVLVPAILLLVLFALTGVLLNERRISGQLQAAFASVNGTELYAPQKYSPLQLEVTSTGIAAYVADANGIAVLQFSDRRQFSVKAGGASPALTKVARYEIVVGCFSKLENAKKLIRQLNKKAIHSELSGKNEKGLFLVQAGRFDERSQALTQIEQLHDKQLPAWVREVTGN
jgi:hypothetical protein